jgi:hypothetical protein
VFDVELDVQDDADEPVPHASVSIAGEAAGTSDVGGRLRVALRGREGDRLPVLLECPAGFGAVDEQSQLTLRSVRPLQGHEPRALTHALRCKPNERAAVVVIRVAGAEHVPVSLDGMQVGTTDAHGFAHLYVSRDPGTRVEVSLDTSAQHGLMPQNPSRSFEIAERDALFVFDQSFKQRPTRAPRERAAPAEPPIPTRLR